MWHILNETLVKASPSPDPNKPFLSTEPHSTLESFLALHPAALGSILGVPKNFSFDVAEIY